MNKKRNIYKFLCLIFFLLHTGLVAAQELTQTIRGVVVDKESQFPLPGVNLVIINSDPLQGTVTDANGNFVIEHVPLGRHSLKITFISYENLIIPDIVIYSGKEIVLHLEMEESVIIMEEVVIKASSQKEKTLNDMATVSARTFTIEETQRFAGSFNDPARMVANYAGVVGVNDQRNDIIIRGNSPISVGWRLEGMDIPNPNHFGVHGTTGGPVSMLNNNLLANSDFFTSAFPAEYGNAIAGVFDLKMRNGNNQKHEFLGQVGFNGFELMAEGPLPGKNRGSYMASYRYSTLEAFDALNINIGVPAVPKYQDLTFKFHLPTEKAGVFSLFGIGGINSIAMLESKRDTAEWTYGASGFDLIFGSYTGITGLSHTYFINPSTYTKLTISATTWFNDSRVDSIVKTTLENFRFAEIQSKEDKYSIHFFLNKKFNARLSSKTGFFFDRYAVDAHGEARIAGTNNFKKFVDYSGNPNMFRAYSQWKYKLINNLEFIPGVHYQHFLFNNTDAFEPRLGIRWSFAPTQSLNLGYGLHSRLQPWPTYLYTVPVMDTLNRIIDYVTNNKKLGFTRSHQFVIGYDYSFSEHLRLKSEIYYQHLFNVPVESDSSTVSMLNFGADFGIPVYDKMVNDGTGKNFGIELTLEKFFSKEYYFLLTSSLFESKYKASDGVERSTAFNGNYMFNFLIGKEFYLGKIKAKRILAVDAKVALSGGKRYIPYEVKPVLNPTNGDTLSYYQEFDYSRAYQEKYSDYFRFDIRISYRTNGKKTTQEWALDIQNMTNHQNIMIETIDRSSGKIRTEYQLGAFPMLLYRIHF